LKIFFQWCTEVENITKYKKDLSQNIFSLIELCGQQYDSIMVMPIQRFYDLLKWKINLDKEKQKQLEEGQY
jgi:hypothetical protein